MGGSRWNDADRGQTFTITNPTWTDLGANPGLCGSPHVLTVQISDISGPHGSEYDNDSFLGYRAVLSR
jgi:hypothetical protein